MSEKILSSQQALYELMHRTEPCTTKGKIFKRKLFKDIRFSPSGNIAAIYRIFLGAEKIAIASERLYFYKLEKEGEDFLNSRAEELQKLYEEIYAKYPELQEKNFTYSVVIPHYNNADLLPKMIASIPEREDIQIIVCDDGSEPEEVEKLKKITHKNLELVLLDHQNGGRARNQGLKRSTGKWFISVDADDFFSSNAFDVFDKYKDREELDFIMFRANFNNYFNGKKYKHPGNIAVTKYLREKNSASEQLIRVSNLVIWNRLVKMSFIRKNNIVFYEHLISDDALYALHVGIYAKNFEVLPDELYCIGENPHSMTRRKRSIEREFWLYLARQRENGFYRKLGLMKYWRYDILYVPYILLKHGPVGLYKFFKIYFTHLDERRKAREAYLHIIDNAYYRP